MSDISLQQSLTPMGPDPSWPGFMGSTPTTMSFNRAGTQELMWSRVLLFSRAGNLSKALTNNVRTMLVTDIVAMVVVVVIYIAIVAVIVSRLHLKKAPSKAPSTVVGYGLVACVVAGVLVWYLEREMRSHRHERFYFKTIPDIIAASQTVSAGSAATMPGAKYLIPDAERKAVRERFDKAPTIGEQLTRYGHVPRTTVNVDMLKKVTRELAREAYVLAGGKRHGCSDDFWAQRLALGYSSCFADHVRWEDWPDAPSAVREHANVVYDFSATSPIASHSTPMWQTWHALIRCLGAWPGCHVFVHVDARDPAATRLVAIQTVGRWFTPKSAPSHWMCAKAILCMDSLFLVEAAHLCMHKISELHTLAFQRHVPLTSQLHHVIVPFTLGALVAEAELNLFLINPVSANTVFSFVQHETQYVATMGQLLGHMLRTPPVSPVAADIPWWGAHQQSISECLRSTYTTLLSHESAHVSSYANACRTLMRLDEQADEGDTFWSGANKVDDVSLLCNVLEVVSVHHASATFDGARTFMTGLAYLGIGLMQRGVAHTPSRWTKWRELLPRLGADDFTLWFLETIGSSTTTGASGGMYLLDSSNYLNLSSANAEAIAAAADQLACIAQTNETLAERLQFKPTWYFPQNAALKSQTVLTSGTYV